MIQKFIQRITILGANGLAAFMDFGVGALISALVVSYFGIDVTWYHLLFGGICALLPDFDLLPPVIMGISAQYDHRQTIFHRPLIVLPIVAIATFVLASTMWAIIATTCVFWHYLHDIDWTAKRYGIALFWPFSKKYWSWYGSYTVGASDEHHEWLTKHWLKPSSLSISEIIVGLLTLALALRISNIPSELVEIFLVIIISGVIFVWSLRKRTQR